MFFSLLLSHICFEPLPPLSLSNKLKGLSSQKGFQEEEDCRNTRCLALEKDDKEKMEKKRDGC